MFARRRETLEGCALQLPYGRRAASGGGGGLASLSHPLVQAVGRQGVDPSSGRLAWR